MDLTPFPVAFANLWLLHACVLAFEQESLNDIVWVLSGTISNDLKTMQTAETHMSKTLERMR